MSTSLENALYPRFSCQSEPCPISGAGVSGRSRTLIWSAAIAQLVEHVIRNDGVTGSSPVCGTSSPPEQVRWNADAIECQLAHVDNDSVKRAYARACLAGPSHGLVSRDAGLQSIIDVQADQAIATAFFDKALRSRKVATGPIDLINNADFVPNPVRGCRPCFERYRNIWRSSVMVSGQA